MFRVNKVVEAVSTVSKSSCVPVAIEQFPAKEFFNNSAGWSKNDLAAIVAATTKQEYDMLVERLKVNEPQFNVADDTKLSDAIKSIKPRWCQSANEVVNYIVPDDVGLVDEVALLRSDVNLCRTGHDS